MPVLRRATYAELGLQGWTYDRFELDEAALPGFVEQLDGAWAGLSPAMPLKRMVFLDVELADAVHRVGLDAPRPLLAVNPRQRWRELMEARRPLYTEVARAIVATGGRTPAEVADAVLEALALPRDRTHDTTQ